MMNRMALLFITLVSAGCVSIDNSMGQNSIVLSEIRSAIEKETSVVSDKIVNISILNVKDSLASGFVEVRSNGAIQDYFFEAEIAEKSINLTYFEPYDP